MHQRREPMRRLIVRIKDGPNQLATLDYWAPELLEAQLSEFTRRKGRGAPRRPEDLHTFHNSRGDVLSFADHRYVSHEVLDLTKLDRESRSLG
jgi:hypothetical protein